MLGWSKHERFTVQVWEEWDGTKSVPSILTVMVDAYWCNIYHIIAGVSLFHHQYCTSISTWFDKKTQETPHFCLTRKYFEIIGFSSEVVPLQAKWENSTGYKTRSSQVPSSFTHQMQLHFCSPNLNALQYPLPSAPPISIASAPISQFH